MIIYIDLDGTIVEPNGGDPSVPLRMKPGAREGLAALKAAGHKLVLWSSRMSPVVLEDPRLDPLLGKKAHRIGGAKAKQWHRARQTQMLEFVRRELPRTFDAIDQSKQGKPPSADMFIDNKALRFGNGPSALNWSQIAEQYGDSSAPARRQ